MIILGSPVGKRHLVQFARDAIFRLFHRICPKHAVKIHFVYFSCARDFQLLIMSLKSLVEFGGRQVGSVYVVEDAKNQFDAELKDDLKKIVSDLEFLCLGNIDWASIDTLRSELTAFSIVSKNVDPNDFIAKVDSDILFFCEKKLNEISVCRAAFVGDGHYSDYRYAQGGLYFLRASLAAALSSEIHSGDLSRAIEEAGCIAEDQVVSALVRKYTKKVWLTRIMLFPDEFEKVDLNNFLVRNEFSSIHFVHKKSEMRGIFEKMGM